MPKRTGHFRRDSHFDLSTPDNGGDARLNAIIIDHALNGPYTIDEMPAVIHEWAKTAAMALKQSISHIGLHVTTLPAQSTAPAAVAEPRQKQPAKSAKSKNNRSEGARQAWGTRRLVDTYMDEHPGISRADAFQAVIAQIPGRTRVTDPNAPLSRGEKAFKTRVMRAMRDAEAAGSPMSEEDARKMVSRNMRGARRAVNETPAASEPLPPTGTEGAGESGEGESTHQQAA